MRVHDNQVVCAAGQALTVTAIGSVSIDGNTLATRERKHQPTDPLDFGIEGACVYVLDMGLPVWAQELALLIQMASSGATGLNIGDFQQVDSGLAGYPDGRVLFHNNQVTFNTSVPETVESLGQMIDNAWFQKAWAAATFSALFVSLDDISLNGNQFQATAPLYLQEGLQAYQTQKLSIPDLLAYFLKFIHVGTAGTTVRASNNGLSELLYSNWLSYASNASVMNLTTSNEATHLYLTNAPKDTEANNLSLF